MIRKKKDPRIVHVAMATQNSSAGQVTGDPRKNKRDLYQDFETWLNTWDR